MARPNPFRAVSQFLFRPLERMIKRTVDRRLKELGYLQAGPPPAAGLDTLQLERELLRIESLRRKLYPADGKPHVE
jgi:hypothetical protein